jgi:hypothetical protein
LTFLKSRYQTTMPNAFQIGDIVEIIIAFVVLPVRGGRYIMVPQLGALTLLDTKVGDAQSPVTVRARDIMSHHLICHKCDF